MTRATLTLPTGPTTVPLHAGTKSAARPDLGSRPDGDIRRSEIPRLAGTSRSTRRASTTAGVGLLAMSVLSAFGYLVAVKGVVAPGNAARTSMNLAGREGTFGLGILSLYAVAALDVVVAWALYRMFTPVSAGLSRLAAGLRTAYAAVFMVAISQLVGALRLHTQALRQIHTFTNIWDAGLVLFGLNLLVLAYIAYRSVFVPQLLAMLLAIAGFGYIFDSITRALVRSSSSDVSAITGMGELVFALWLVTRGRRIAVDNSGPDAYSMGAAR